MKQGYVITQQLEDAPEVDTYIISEEDFENLKQLGFLKTNPEFSDCDPYLTCAYDDWEDLDINAIQERPVIILGLIDLYLS